MKKNIIIAFLFLFASVSASFSATTYTTPNTGMQVYGGVAAADVVDPNGVLIGKCSKGVRAYFAYATTGYAIASKHDSGSKAYGTSHDSTAIYFAELASAGAFSPPEAGNVSDFATWTAM